MNIGGFLETNIWIAFWVTYIKIAIKQTRKRRIVLTHQLHLGGKNCNKVAAWVACGEI